MKKFFYILISTILAWPTILINRVSAQLINNPDELKQMTDETAQSSNLGSVEVGSLVAKGIQIVLGFLAVIFLSLTLMAGFRWMTAAGNEDQIKKATSTLKAAIIGLIIVLAAYTITYFVFKALPFSGGGTSTVGTSG